MTELKPIDIAYLNKITEKNKPKVIDSRVENGIQVKVYEAKEASNHFAVNHKGVRGLHYD